MSEAKEQSVLPDQPKTTYFSGILYHGAKNSFEFNPAYDYSNLSLTTDGSWTLGPGLYLIDNALSAKNYSKVRQSNEDANHYVYEFIINNGKFLDFRDKTNGNLGVTKDMLEGWTNFFAEYLKKEKIKLPDVGPERERIETPSGQVRIKVNPFYSERKKMEEYLAYLNELQKKDKVDLRAMLGTRPVGETVSGFRGNPVGLRWGGLFREFVTQELGFDGIIYIEGGEGSRLKSEPTFAIYNLDVVKSNQLIS